MGHNHDVAGSSPSQTTKISAEVNLQRSFFCSDYRSVLFNALVFEDHHGNIVKLRCIACKAVELLFDF